MTQTIVHYGCHFLIPLVVALLFFKSNWKFAFLIMILGLLIDLDHLVATPIFNPNRCSINFHPLHSYFATAIYLLLIIPQNTRLIGLGLVIHIFSDSVDCFMM
jgi:hypothetical protein